MLTLKTLQQADLLRLPDFGHGDISSWSPTDWACAMSGECGEACNLIKKMRRGEAIPIKEVADELADLVCYVALLASRLDIDLEASVISKFNEVSDRVGSNVKL